MSNRRFTHGSRHGVSRWIYARCVYSPSPQSGDPEARPPAVGDLIEAARLLGVVTVPDPVEREIGRPGDLLALSAIVLGAAENQVVQAEQAAVDAGGGLATVCDAADLTAHLMCDDDTWQTRQWLGWHTGRLVHHLERAEGEGHLPVPAGEMAAECVRAVLILLHHFVADGAAHIPIEQRERFRGALTAVLRRIDDM